MRRKVLNFQMWQQSSSEWKINVRRWRLSGELIFACKYKLVNYIQMGVCSTHHLGSKLNYFNVDGFFTPLSKNWGSLARTSDPCYLLVNISDPCACEHVGKENIYIKVFQPSFNEDGRCYKLPVVGTSQLFCTCIQNWVPLGV